MALLQFPEPEIHHCHSCGCQQWFYPESYPAPDVILCWRCRGAGAAVALPKSKLFKADFHGKNP